MSTSVAWKVDISWVPLAGSSSYGSMEISLSLSSAVRFTSLPLVKRGIGGGGSRDRVDAYAYSRRALLIVNNAKIIIKIPNFNKSLLSCFTLYFVPIFQ